MFTALAPYGVPNVPFDIALDYRIDFGGQGARPQDARGQHARRGQDHAGLVIDGISDKSGMAGAKDDGRLRSASLSIDDSGLSGRAAAGLRQGGRHQAGRDRAVGAGSHRSLRRAAGAGDLEGAGCRGLLHRRLESAQRTAGPGLKPEKTAGLSDLDKVMMPDALTTIFGFTATYPGTKEGARQGRRDSAKKMKRRALLAAGLRRRPFAGAARMPIRRGLSR